METKNLALLGLLYLVSLIESNQYCDKNCSLLATKVQNLETQVQIFSSLLQIQSTIIAKYIDQGELATGTTSISSDNSDKITKQANEIKELQRNVAALKHAMETQEMIRVLNDNFEKLINAISSTVSSGTVNILLTKINQKLSALNRSYKTQDSHIKRLESAMASGTWASGKYCILASGSCPGGFTRITTWMKAIKVFRGSRRFLQQANFGDSNIRCYGPCARSDQWLGELTIVACCK